MSAKDFRDENTDFLFDAIISLKNIEECYSFFEDLCTIAEIKEMSKRLLVAKMLNENCVYSKISETTGLITATNIRVNRCLKYGSDGYQTVLKRLNGDEESK